MKNKLLALGLGAWLLGGALSYGHEGKGGGDHDWDDHDDKGHHGHHGHEVGGEEGSKDRVGVPAVPDSGPAWMVVPLVGGLLLYHWRSRREAAGL